jgi:hypothetical protein
MTKRTVILLAAALLSALPMAAQGTFNPYLPDATLINYSGDQSIISYLSLPVDPRRSLSVSNTADCGYQGTQGNPGTYAGYGIGGRVGFTVANSPSARVPQCYPIHISLNASWISRRPDGVNDHLYQALYVNAEGSLPGGYPADNTQFESCSLIGNNGGVGTPHTVVFQEGVCVYYGGNGGVQ